MKMGPVSKVKRSVRTVVMLSPAERAAFEAEAHQRGLSLASFIRMQTLTGVSESSFTAGATAIAEPMSLKEAAS